MISNTQRNELIANLLAYDLNACQFKFIIYLYNTTINLQKLSLHIPNMAKLGRDLGYDKSNFHKAINEIISLDIINVMNKRYSINLDAKTWQVYQNEVKTVRKRMNKDISKQLSS